MLSYIMFSYQKPCGQETGRRRGPRKALLPHPSCSRRAGGAPKSLAGQDAFSSASCEDVAPHSVRPCLRREVSTLMSLGMGNEWMFCLCCRMQLENRRAKHCSWTSASVPRLRTRSPGLDRGHSLPRPFRSCVTFGGSGLDLC